MAIVKSDLNDWPRFWLKPFFEEEEWGEAVDSLSAYETDEAFVVKANVPGVPADKVDVSVEGGVVTIKAEHEETKEEKSKRKVVYREGRTAKYLYTTSIPCPVMADKAKAEIENGVVTVTIPKAPEAKPKKIKVLARGK